MLLWEIVTYCDQPYVELDTNGIIAKIEMKSLSLPRCVLSHCLAIVKYCEALWSWCMRNG